MQSYSFSLVKIGLQSKVLPESFFLNELLKLEKEKIEGFYIKQKI